MASCKFCGRPVEAARVFHRECWVKEAEKLLSDFCDHYCKWPECCQNQDELDEHCDCCALLGLVNLGE